MNDRKKMTTPSRKLRHTAKASLTVFTAEKGGGDKNSFIPFFCNVLYCFVTFCNFFVIFGGQIDRLTDLGIEAPSRSLTKVVVNKLIRL